MKTLTNLMSMILILVIIGVTVNAQETKNQPTKKQQKEQAEKIEKGAKADAKRFKKEGYTNPIGTQPLDMQFERAWKMESELLDDGHPKYIVEIGSAVAETQSAAKVQAFQSAKMTIAGNISSQVGELAKNNFSNAQLNSEEATSVTKTIATSQTLVAQSLGRIITLVEATRPVGKNIEYNVRLAYDFNEAKTIAKNILRKQLEEDAKLMQEKIDKIINF